MMGALFTWKGADVTDEKKVMLAMEVFIADIERVMENFLAEAAPVVAKHPQWYEIKDKDGDFVCAEWNDLEKLLAKSIPMFEDKLGYIESVGYDYQFFLERLAGEVWDIVKKRINDEQGVSN